jgi:serine/threonine protein kinase
MPPPKIIAGRYEVLRELGRGGMGVVYLVQHVHTHERLALKLLSAHVEAKPEAVERFRREMRAPALIKSDHVVRIMDADLAAELDGAPFYVMEYLVGCDVAHVLKERGKLTGEETVWILMQVARGLDKAHQAGIVHRDLKPDNLFVHQREDGSLIVKVFDFGLVRFTQQGAGSDHRALTNTQSMLGTPLYMAPEQATGGDNRAPIGPPADIWAIGMVCYELLTGKTYFGFDTLLQFVGQLLFSELLPPSRKAPELPPAFDDWFARSCHRTPGERFASVGAQIAALAQALGCDVNRIGEAAPPRLRQTLLPPEPKPQPQPTSAAASNAAAPGAAADPPPADPSLGAVPTINAPKPLTLGSTPTVMEQEPSLGAFPTMNAPLPIHGKSTLITELPIAPPDSKRRVPRGLWVPIALALFGLALFFLRSRSTAQDSTKSSTPGVIDLATPRQVDLLPPGTPDLAEARRDLGVPAEMYVPIPDRPREAIPRPKAVRPGAPNKRPMRPQDKRPPPVHKSPEEYVHPTL